MTVIGFKKQKQFFRDAVAAGRLAQAYLFTGEELIGKRAFALELIEQLGGEKLLVEEWGIEAVRGLQRFLSLTALAGRYRSVLIDNAHQLTEEAQSALLKILEEPPASGLLFLVTPYPQQLLPTVLSRCQLIRFTAPTDQRLARYPTAAVQAASVELEHLRRAGLPERFAFAQKMSDDKNRANLQMLVKYWLLASSARVSERNLVKVTRGLLTLHRIISQPQYNARLALENFLVNI